MCVCEGGGGEVVQACGVSEWFWSGGGLDSVGGLGGLFRCGEEGGGKGANVGAGREVVRRQKGKTWGGG